MSSSGHRRRRYRYHSIIMLSAPSSLSRFWRAVLRPAIVRRDCALQGTRACSGIRFVVAKLYNSRNRKRDPPPCENGGSNNIDDLQHPPLLRLAKLGCRRRSEAPRFYTLSPRRRSNREEAQDPLKPRFGRRCSCVCQVRVCHGHLCSGCIVPWTGRRAWKRQRLKPSPSDMCAF